MITATLPRDGNRVPLLNSVLTGATLASTYDATVSASTEITLNAATTSLTVTALAQPILLRWGTSDVSTSAFDAVIPANQTTFFAVPTGTTAVNFIEGVSGAILIVIEQ